ncbi:hypothetical protein IFM89_021116 [Coptis chinensis]|uniref:Uncharacterized protein n=1 Tax=Coptis chinensis TaxID=261450 RepID=A0A835HLP7_9MAGN|nr:hypothetical protein IFM89_021116 [Coptis chinensis]
MIADRELFYFKFFNDEDKQMVIDQGSIFLAGRILVVRPWSTIVEEYRNGIKAIPIWKPSHEDQALDIVLAKSPEDSTSLDHSMVIFNEKVDELTENNASEDLSFMKPQDLNSAELHNLLNAKEHHDSCYGNDATASEKDYFYDHTYEARES